MRTKIKYGASFRLICLMKKECFVSLCSIACCRYSKAKKSTTKNCAKNSIDYFSMHNVHCIVYNKPQGVYLSSFSRLGCISFIFEFAIKTMENKNI